MRRVAAILAFVLLAAGMQVPALADDLESARRLTWSRATRAEGIAALRALVEEDADARDPRLELGRVLTWNRETRAEGIAILREVRGDFPDSADVQESLAEVLSWSGDTRDEAVTELRDLVQRQPQRTSAKVLLAEILSWSRDTRAESIAIYREAVSDDPDSTDARVGLARTLSWTGEFDDARDLYTETLSQIPETAAARAGLAEVERWSGRPRAALRALDEAPGDGNELPIHLQRAQAYQDIDRPARALAEYERALELVPDNETALHGAAEARRLLRPRLETGVTASTEDGNSRTTKVEWVDLPTTFFWHPGDGDLESFVRVGPTWVDNKNGTTEVLRGAAGLETPLGNRVRLRTEAEYNDFEDADSEITGRLDLRFAALDRLRFRAGFQRRLEQDSRLAMAGERIGGVLYGPAILDDVYLGASGRPGNGWDWFLQGATGSIQGKNLMDNDRDAVYAGFGRSFRQTRHSFRVGYSFTWLSYDLNLNGYPPDALGGDGTTAEGVGGYFSPDDFVNHMARYDGTWRYGDGSRIDYGGGLGTQTVKELDDDDDQTASDFYIANNHRFNDRWALRSSLTYQNVAAAFNRTRLRVFVIRNF